MQNSAGGEIILTELLDVQRLSEMAQSQTPQKTINDVCRLCGDNFIDKKNKHRLILCHDDFKPPYTLALEELTGPIKTNDVLTFICRSCRTLLKKYRRSYCEVERIGSVVKSMSNAHAAVRVKRCAKSTPTADSRDRKRIVPGENPRGESGLFQGNVKIGYVVVLPL